MDGLNRRILRRAARIVVLDRFMAERVQRKLPTAAKTTILPPWPHNDPGVWIEHADNPWRRKNARKGRRIVMYSGNHTPAHPLDTLLEAALRLRDEDGLDFLFVGGGLGKRAIDAAIEQQRPRHIRSLPYQPLEILKYSLAAADVHVVAVGDRLVGLSHPCKIYGALAAGRPVLLFGPAASHATDILARHAIGWHVAHGDVDGAVAALREIRSTSAERLETMGRAAQALVRSSYSLHYLLHRFCDQVDGCRHRRPSELSSNAGG